ncbi:hypothetical protein OAO81_00030 [Candidatus Pelagibacter ubique]|nr:hypothetical protein [Candidatus Pelagibacter ubique]
MININNPIVLIIYNRIFHTRKILDCLKNFNYNKIYIIADGPKNNNLDVSLVKKTRFLIDLKLKNKKVIKIYSKFNLGLRIRIITGLNEVFKKEKTAIILEDDCLPTEEFFCFINLMLKRYKNNKKISSICGSNHLSKWINNRSSYLMSKYFNSWGWATWQDRWQKVDFDNKNLLKVVNNHKFIHHIGSYRALFYWRYILKKILRNKINSWAYTYNYFNFIKKKYHIIPTQNLINNVGIGIKSTNTKVLPVKYFFSKLKLNKTTSFSFKHDKHNFNKYDTAVEDIIFSKSLINRIKWIIAKINIFK